ncbi:MAG: trigger factor [Legionellales bacterium]|nr:trigger factor [Legionellales bacterium]
MQVSVESIGALQRRLVIELPWTTFESRESKELKKLQQRAKIAGFRPGKAPLDIVRRQTPELKEMVAAELFRENIEEALEKVNNNPDLTKLAMASEPRLEPVNIENGQPVKLSCVFEVYPEIDMKLLNDIEVKRQTATLEEADLDAALEKLRGLFCEWISVTRAAQSGDRIQMDFEGFIDEQPFSGNAAKDFQLQLGSHRMINGFEEGLLGVVPGEERTLNLTFPEEYHAADLAGKPVKFNVKVHLVEEPKLPELGEELAKKLGVADGSIEELRQVTRVDLSRELDITMRNRLKEEIFKKWLNNNIFEVPTSLVLREANELLNEIKAKRKANINKEAILPALFEEAKKRVMLGLLINKMVELHEIKPHPERIQALIEQRASAYENQEDVIKMFLNDKELKREMEFLSIEEQVVEKLLTTAIVIDEILSFEDLMQRR